MFDPGGASRLDRDRLRHLRNDRRGVVSLVFPPEE